MSTVHFQLTYDGPELSGHGMDVADLAPALLGLGELVKRANELLNRDAAQVKLVVQSDFEHKCFQVNFDLFQTVMQHLDAIFSDERVRTAKEIAEWLGITGDTLGLFKFLAIRAGRKIEKIEPIEGAESTAVGSDHVRVTFEGDKNTIVVNNNVVILQGDEVIRRQAARVAKPLLSEGIERLEFNRDAPNGKGDVITKDEAIAISNTAAIKEEPVLEEYPPQFIEAHIRVTRPDLEDEEAKWRFFFHEKNAPVDVSASSIPADVRARGGVGIGDTWKVRLQVTEKKTASGIRTDYKVAEVLEFIPGPKQSDLFGS